MSIKYLSKGLTIGDLKKKGVSHLSLPAHPNPHPHIFYEIMKEKLLE
jgi:hypothetical protein